MNFTFSEQLNHMISMLRRRINDTDTDAPLYEDEDLYYFLTDAVDELELYLFKKNRYISDGEFRDVLTNKEIVVPHPERIIYVIQAAILVITAIKIKADRDNFALRKPTLSVDTSRQSQDHAKTLEILKEDLTARIVSVVSSTMVGYRFSGDEI